MMISVARFRTPVNVPIFVPMLQRAVNALATALLLLTSILIAGCDIFEPATSLEALNETGTNLEVLAAPCGRELTMFATLPDGASHIEQVEAGRWCLEGWTDDGRAGVVEINIAGGLHRVPFRPE